ncbi:MAG: T9SS type A sorting domain-containing protein [Bacteroidales bacterium]|nr:T9SS type A sorting domain-containing protein [Bacteroidales bacterium]MCF8401555.1 T9SS type A sorting domain-containing protein [Bacteroidales bacterium]
MALQKVLKLFWSRNLSGFRILTGLKQKSDYYGKSHQFNFAHFNLSLEEQQIHEQYEDLFDILWSMQADSINPDSTMTQTLLSLSAHKSIPGAYAMNRLIHDSAIIYNEPVYLPDLLKSAPVYPENPYKGEKDYIMNIFPNPAGDYLIIDYDLSEYIGNLYLKMTDIQGKQSKTIKLINSRTQKVVSTNKLPNGTYFMQLFLDNDVLETTKIVIHK